MRVLVLTPSLYDTSPGSRFRIEQWARHLQRAGWQFTFVPFDDNALHSVLYKKRHYTTKSFHMLRRLAARTAVLPLVLKHDVVFVYEEAARLGPPLLERWISRRRPLVYDFCDPIWLPYVSQSNNWLSYLKNFTKCDEICSLSDQVIVGNTLIGEFAKRFNSAVTVVPITIDMEQYGARDPSELPDGVPVVGWSGSASTRRHLESLVPVLDQLSARVRFRLKVIGTEQPDLRGLPFSFVPWRASTEVEDLQSLDIGIMPITTDRWSQLRTHLKVRQYMGVGVPAVATRAGIMHQIITDGSDGFLADSAQEWLEKLTRLIGDAVLRRKIGLAGRRTAEQQFSAQAWIPTVQRIFEAAASRS